MEINFFFSINEIFQFDREKQQLKTHQDTRAEGVILQNVQILSYSFLSNEPTHRLMVQIKFLE